MRKSSDSKSVGGYIRQAVIPAGMSVKDAATKLGVGRPALSNLLNGRASLSPEMAIRLEKAFGADRGKLLDMQARLDQASNRESEKIVAVHAYVPSFLTIKARQIQEWAGSNVDARHELAVLLRKLIRSTAHDLRLVDFPGYDNAQRRGWDGRVETDSATPWVPEGFSGWEFGADQKVRKKADDDYAARVASVSPSERRESTFVFVSPRNWPAKNEWAASKHAARTWKAVRAFDASDLEQWLEESIAAQVWLSERLQLPTQGIETLDNCWQRWSTASHPVLAREIFSSAMSAHEKSLKLWLEQPCERPFVVAADSTDEALAFLACIFERDELARWKDLAAVFRSAEVLRRLGSSSAPFIPITSSVEAERELASIYRRMHSIVVRARNMVDSTPDVSLDLLSHQAFGQALAAMGIDRDDVDRLDRESGRSPTILRRRLSKIDAIRKPVWAEDGAVPDSLVPIALVGTWHAASSADREILSALANSAYEDIEQRVARLLRYDDSPVWSIGQYRGVASKLDCLFAIRKTVTQKHLDDFFLVAEYALSEADPALELPEDQQWAAAIHGKVRNHSGALRTGICETLVLLAVHGDYLFRQRLGVHVESRVSLLVRRLLSPLTHQVLLSHDLPRYAEAAPESFVELVEEDLRQPQPVVESVLKPVTSFPGRCQRTGLLWALECVAWKPQFLARVTAILAQLSRTKIDDNWSNKPIASLQAIYRCWMPQTAASLRERTKALEALARRFPDIGWQVCVEQFGVHPRMGMYSYRPHWRSDSSGAGHPVTRGEALEFSRKALDLTLHWPAHDEATLGDLVGRLGGMPVDDQVRVWTIVEGWADVEPEPARKARLRERIRRSALTVRRQGDLDESTRERAWKAYNRLLPEDPVLKHAWLFAKQWVEESADEIEEAEIDYTKREVRIHVLRQAAFKEVWDALGFSGVRGLLAATDAPHMIGHYAATLVCTSDAIVTFAGDCFSIADDMKIKMDGCMQGLLRAVDADVRRAALVGMAASLDADLAVRLFCCAPFAPETWRLVDEYRDEIKTRYWQEVIPWCWDRHDEAALLEMVDRFLEAGRPRLAFRTVSMDWDNIETSRLRRLLLAVATVNREPDYYRIDAYDVAEALQSLDGRPEVGQDDMAQLEFLYLGMLEHTQHKHGIRNLERQIAASPALFAQLVALAFKRRDNEQDSPEWGSDDPERRAAMVSAAYQLLDRIAFVPGTQPDRSIATTELVAWLHEARRICTQYGRSDSGDHCIGQLLAKAPADENGLWPREQVCEAMEGISSESLARGFHMAVHNARGVVMRGEGGAQERELAAKYRGWAQEIAPRYPFVGGALEGIAASYDREAEWHDSEESLGRRLMR
jgi:addiction module HigA family antidote